MKNFLLFWCSIGLLLAATSSAALAADRVQGAIKAARVKGQVTIVAADGSRHALVNGEAISQGCTVITGSQSGVILFFANGSSINLSADSSLSVDEFLVDPFAEDVNAADLKEEPSSSSTKLNLAYGELVGNVKKLNSRSSYQVQTPVGAAGIRGTTFRIVYRPSGTGQAFVSISVGEGQVVFEGVAQSPIPIPENSEVVVEATVNPDGSITLSTPTVQPISTDSAQNLENALTEAEQAELDAVVEQILPPPPHEEDLTPGAGQGGTGGGGDGSPAP